MFNCIEMVNCKGKLVRQIIIKILFSCINLIIPKWLYYDTDSDIHFTISLNEIAPFLLEEIWTGNGKCEVLEIDIMKRKV